MLPRERDINEQLNALNDRIAFEQLQRQDNNKLDDGSKELVSQYNCLIDDMDAARPKPPLTDPLVTLPPDLWEYIIRDSLSPDFDFDIALAVDRVNLDYTSSAGPKKWVVDQLLCLTTVSRHWRVSLLSTPVLWTNICIIPQIEDLEAKIDLCIQLSADLPLKLYWNVPVSAEIWTAIGPAITRQASRIRLIHLYCKGDDPDNLNGISENVLLNLLGDLSSLEVLSSVGPIRSTIHVDATSVLKQAKSIRSLQSVEINEEVAAFSALKSLRYIEARKDMFQILPLLKEMETLREVTFSPCSSTRLTSEEAQSQKAQTVAALKNVYLPWRSLKIVQGLVKPVEPILRCVSSTLVELRLLIDWRTLSEVLLICGQMDNLEHLHLGFTCPNLYYFQSLPECQGPPKLHTLALFIGETHAFGESNGENDIKTTAADDCLFETLILWAPVVKHLTITSCSSRLSPCYYVETLSQLQHLSLTYRNPLEGEAPRQFKLNTVETVQIFACDGLFRALSCPKATRLITEFCDATRCYVYGYNSRIGNENWGNLRTVDVSYFQKVWSGESMLNLETVTLKDSTPFIQHLANHPTKLPSLKHLRIKEIPEWCLLFIMLERRNFRRAEGVALISKLALPSIPPPSILQPLVSRLRGRLSARPSNFDLSLDSISPLFLDMKVPGCDYCLNSFMSCDRVPDIETVSSKQLQLPPYPSTNDQVLEHASQRGKPWTLRIREEPCRRHNVVDLTEIDAYTKVDQYALSSHLSV